LGRDLISGVTTIPPFGAQRLEIARSANNSGASARSGGVLAADGRDETPG